VNEVVALLRRLVEANRGSIVLNAVGLSRGGAACLLLAQAVQRHFGDDAVNVSLLVFDPVPGNTITSAKLDVFGATLARQCMDLRDVRCLKRVLGLYPHVPLPDYLMHAPVMPRYSDGTHVEEEVILGCHQGAIYSWDLMCAHEQLRGLDRRLSFVRIRDWLQSCGTRFSSRAGSVTCPDLFSLDSASVVQELVQLLQGGVFEPTLRHTHRCCL
jgi:hypothetical protein